MHILQLFEAEGCGLYGLEDVREKLLRAAFCLDHTTLGVSAVVGKAAHHPLILLPYRNILDDFLSSGDLQSELGFEVPHTRQVQVPEAFMI